jgi:DNA-binding transcriptional MocR family regulator
MRRTPGEQGSLNWFASRTLWVVAPTRKLYARFARKIVSRRRHLRREAAPMTGISHPFLEGGGPLYLRLARGLKSAVLNGRYQPGYRLPSVRHLSQTLGLSLNTVHQAVRLLEAEGWVEIRPQAGCFVAHQHAVPSPSCVATPLPVRRSDLGLRVLMEANNSQLTRLGSTMPNPALLPTQEVRRHLVRLSRQDWPNRYDFPRGTPELRQQLARVMLTAGVSVSPDDLLLSSGCQEAVVACLRAVCRPGDVVAVESPTFFGYLEALEMLSLQAVEIRSDPQTGMSIGALRQVLERHPLACVLVTPNFSNPQGSLMPDSAKSELVQLVTDAQIALIENDIQGDLGYSSPRPLAAKAWDQQGRVLYCSSFSKTLGPEFRVGWVAAGRYTAAVERWLTFATLGSSSLVRRALADYLAGGSYPSAMRRAQRAYSRQARQTYESLGGLPAGSRVNLPQGGKMLWVELPAHVDALELYQRCREEGLSLTPGHLYSTAGGYEHCVRLNCSYFTPEVKEALERVCALARELA